MSGKRLCLVVVCAAIAMISVGAGSAAAAGSPTVLMFHNTPGQFTPIGFDANSNAIPPVGSSYVITVVLINTASQFGKPSGTRVGRVILRCTVLTAGGDGLCDGIAHVPNGYFLFAGNGGLGNANVNYYAITGGVAGYANARGQIKVTNHRDGSSDAKVTLIP